MNKLKSLQEAEILKVESYEQKRPESSCNLLTNENIQQSFRENNPYNNGEKEYTLKMKDEEVKNYYEIKNNLKAKLRKSNYNSFGFNQQHHDLKQKYNQLKMDLNIKLKV